jgi:hypothetical protein
MMSHALSLQVMQEGQSVGFPGKATEALALPTTVRNTVTGQINW